jgi:hypothetical protein
MEVQIFQKRQEIRVGSLGPVAAVCGAAPPHPAYVNSAHAVNKINLYIHLANRERTVRSERINSDCEACQEQLVAGRVDEEIIDIRLGILTSVRKHAGTVEAKKKNTTEVNDYPYRNDQCIEYMQSSLLRYFPGKINTFIFPHMK